MQQHLILVDDAMIYQDTVYYNKIVSDTLAMTRHITEFQCVTYVNPSRASHIQTFKYIFMLLRLNNYVYNYNTNKAIKFVYEIRFPK